MSRGDVLAGLEFDTGNPPGYYITLHYWREVFGDTIEDGSNALGRRRGR